MINIFESWEEDWPSVESEELEEADTNVKNPFDVFNVKEEQKDFASDLDDIFKANMAKLAAGSKEFAAKLKPEIEKDMELLGMKYTDNPFDDFDNSSFFTGINNPFKEDLTEDMKRAEELKKKGTEFVNQRAKLCQEFETLRKQHEQKPNDISIWSKADTIRLKILSLTNTIQNYYTEYLRELALSVQ